MFICPDQWLNVYKKKKIIAGHKHYPTANLFYTMRVSLMMLDQFWKFSFGIWPCKGFLYFHHYSLSYCSSISISGAVFVFHDWFGNSFCIFKIKPTLLSHQLGCIFYPSHCPPCLSISHILATVLFLSFSFFVSSEWETTQIKKEDQCLWVEIKH